ncbi:MAG: argininosuccinate synthase domain-containing protein [Micromonosporaceae bacterium]
MSLITLDSGPVGLFQGGGLSSLALGVWLAENAVPTHHYIADIGQSPRADIDELAQSLRQFGAPTTVIDARARMAEIAADLLRYQARHDGGYWNTTGSSRFVLIEQLAPQLLADGCQVLAHGCVGGGNDQRRFARHSQRLAPSLKVYAPWVDPDALRRFPDRETMLKAVNERQLWLDPGSDATRSTDANLAGSSHESADLEDLGTPVTALSPRWSRWATDAPTEAETVVIRFEQGRVVDVDGSGPEPLAWITRCNEVGARHGIWLRDVVERRIIGTVCRGVYEAPGLELLDRAWSRVLQASLDNQAHELYERLSSVVGAAMYEARWLDPAAVAARTAIDVLLADVSAQVTLVAHRGAARVSSIEVASNVVRQTRFGSGGHRWSQVATG